MANADLCPVCYGNGKRKDNWMEKDKTCRGCGGKGWVEVSGIGIINIYILENVIKPKSKKKSKVKK